MTQFEIDFSACEDFTRDLHILNLGAGIQSSTLLLLSVQGELPRLDAAIFSDTGWEPPDVYENVKWLTEVAGKAGIPVHTVGEANIREDALRSQVRGTASNGERWASMPFFVESETGTGMIRRQCTNEYKIRPVEQFIRRELLGLRPKQHWPKGTRINQWFGISSDEMRRVRQSRSLRVMFRYPLIGITEPRLSRAWSRADCIAWLKTEYPGRDFPRSSCVGCPFRSDVEWRYMKKHRPDEWKDACEFDEAVRKCGGMRGDVFLHRELVPLRVASLAGTDKRGTDHECLGVCNT